MNKDKSVRKKVKKSNSTSKTEGFFIDEELSSESFNLTGSLENSTELRSDSLESIFTDNFNQVVDHLEGKNLEGKALEDIEEKLKSITKYQGEKSVSTNTSPTKADKKSLGLSQAAKGSSSVKNLVHHYDSKENLNIKNLTSARPGLRSNFTPLEFNAYGDISKLDPTTRRKSKSSKSSASVFCSNFSLYSVQANLANMGDADLLATQKLIINHLDTELKESGDLIKILLNKENKTNAEMLDLEQHYHNLISLKAQMARKFTKLDNVQEGLLSSSPQFPEFLSLNKRMTRLEGNLSNLFDKVKTVVDSWKRDDVILDAKKMSIPEFYGDYLVYSRFRTSFGQITKSIGKESKKLRLIEALKGTAKERVWDLINADCSYEEIWKALDDHYGNPKNITDATINNLFNIKKPKNVISEISSHFTAYKNQSSNIVTLGHTTEELLAAFYLLQIPGKLRSKIESNLDREKCKYTFKDLTPIIDDICRVENFNNETNSQNEQIFCNLGGTQEQNPYNLEFTEEITAAVGFSTNKPKSNGGGSEPRSHGPGSTHNNSNTQSGQFNSGYVNRGRAGGGGYRGSGYGGGGAARGRGMPYSSGGNSNAQANFNEQPLSQCCICDQKGHPYWRCFQYKHGLEVRKRLQELGRCDACLVHAKEHGPTCIGIYPPNCQKCQSPEHHTITCDGAFYGHPGSCVLSNKNEKT